MTFRILTVCTGNICRSPLAEQLLRRDLAPVPGVEVASAGVGALVGAGMPPQALHLADTLSVTDAAAHVSRQITERMIAESDLVLAMARDHRRAVVEMTPAAMRRVFTVREFAHIVATIDPAELADEVRGSASPDEALKRATALTAMLRGVAAPPAHPDDWDVVDPFRRSDEVYARSGEQLAPAAAAVAAYLREAVRLAAA